MPYVLAFTTETGELRPVWITYPAYHGTFTGDRDRRAELADLDEAQRLAADWNDYLASKGYLDRVRVADATTNEEVRA